LPHRYCYLPLSWKSWNWFECAVGGVRHPQHTVETIVCAPDDGWRYFPKHVEQFPHKLCNVASCWIYVRTFGYLLPNFRHKKFVMFLVYSSTSNFIYLFTRRCYTCYFPNYKEDGRTARRTDTLTLR
jgi:hypothetical protein